MSPTLNVFDAGDIRATALAITEAGAHDPLLPAHLDSHRHRLIGNGVAAPQAQWIGERLRRYLEGTL